MADDNTLIRKPDAKNMLVYISRLTGIHAVEIGVAYYYRGHYLYEPNGNPVVPVPFTSKREGFQMKRQPADSAPRYDAFAVSLVPESEVAALYHGVMNREYMPPTPETDSGSISEHPSPSIEPSTGGPFTTQFFSPHDRANFLANSAPGSRSHSPNYSPNYSPNHSPKPSSSAWLPKVASMTRLNQLRAQEGLPLSIGKLSADWIDDQKISAIINKLTKDPRDARGTLDPIEDQKISAIINKLTKDPRDARGTFDWSTVPTGPKSMVDVLRHQTAAATPPPSVAPVGPPAGSMTPIGTGRPVAPPAAAMAPIGTGRPIKSTTTGRPRGASLILNEAYNAKHPSNSPRLASALPAIRLTTAAASKPVPLAADSEEADADGYLSIKSLVPSTCALETHGEEYDGDTVTFAHQTEFVRQTQGGYVGDYPVLEVNGRQMVDWYMLTKEVKEKERVEWLRGGQRLRWAERGSTESGEKSWC
ncbi:hypothetical protein BDV95DRAFT_594415 [Massariosphaeria phaeospora]|uniref:Uncharacterized protein n=1 Tax=Massariosphaeria phaeospora TaxID=100035 RepID=A0A7C8M952_9PLEO|nr:hypothetical protein BDV95DRAFT_594415 [Massariosphaeria phaeospora]